MVSKRLMAPVRASGACARVNAGGFITRTRSALVSTGTIVIYVSIVDPRHVLNAEIIYIAGTAYERSKFVRHSN